MALLFAILTPLALVNRALLAGGRWLGMAAVVVMVVVILIQVVFRYGFNNALPWPDEAARFCMLWMAGLMAPTAFRAGGFVSIDMVSFMLPRVVAHMLALVLLMMSLLVLVVGLQIGWAEVTGFGGKFTTASLYVPTGFGEWYRVPRSWMMASLLVGVGLLVLVNIELILRSVIAVLGGKDRLPVIATETGGAE